MLARSAAMVSGVVKLSTGIVLHALNEAKLSRLLPSIELRSNVPVRGFAHAAPERVAEDRPLVGDGLALEDAVAGERDGFFGGGLLVPAGAACCSSAFAGGGDNLLRLISEAGGHFFVCGKDLFGGEAFACGRGWNGPQSALPPGRCSRSFPVAL